MLSLVSLSLYSPCEYQIYWRLNSEYKIKFSRCWCRCRIYHGPKKSQRVSKSSNFKHFWRFKNSFIQNDLLNIENIFPFNLQILYDVNILHFRLHKDSKRILHNDRLLLFADRISVEILSSSFRTVCGLLMSTQSLRYPQRK